MERRRSRSEARVGSPIMPEGMKALRKVSLRSVRIGVVSIAKPNVLGNNCHFVRGRQYMQHVPAVTSLAPAARSDRAPIDNTKMVFPQIRR